MSNLAQKVEWILVYSSNYHCHWPHYPDLYDLYHLHPLQKVEDACNHDKFLRKYIMLWQTQCITERPQTHWILHPRSIHLTSDWSFWYLCLSAAFFNRILSRLNQNLGLSCCIGVVCEWNIASSDCLLALLTATWLLVIPPISLLVSAHIVVLPPLIVGSISFWWLHGELELFATAWIGFNSSFPHSKKALLIVQLLIGINPLYSGRNKIILFLALACNGAWTLVLCFTCSKKFICRAPFW